MLKALPGNRKLPSPPHLNICFEVEIQTFPNRKSANASWTSTAFCYHLAPILKPTPHFLHMMAQVLDICLRCNSLQCRASLTERAIVTTCSHIFCLKCAENLGLARSTGRDRQCPACQTSLLNPDDVVSTVLNPTEDYKTSVLSGLDPNTVMECAGRALAFWTYQTAQEIFYQEYLGKNLTDKYSALNKQIDKVIHDANSEVSSLHQRIADLKLGQEQLQKKNQELVELYRDKSKKHAQVTNLYSLLKSRAMRSQLQTAVSDTVANTLQSLNTTAHHTTHGFVANTHSLPASSNSRHELSVSNNDLGIKRLHHRQRSVGSNSPLTSNTMPPPSGLPPSYRNCKFIKCTHRTVEPLHKQLNGLGTFFSGSFSDKPTFSSNTNTTPFPDK
ncbi:hypothetical protein LOZ58_005443 [Ophidiomyces ophidiicola]|nr:hypothetical protein LOZ58_005443 [Ophidiomyces ophidiicola]